MNKVLQPNALSVSDECTLLASGLYVVVGSLSRKEGEYIIIILSFFTGKQLERREQQPQPTNTDHLHRMLERQQQQQKQTRRSSGTG
jgi:hypothetical protein